MAKKIYLKILLLLMMPGFAFAQTKEKTYIIDNILMLQATLSPGYLFYHNGLWNSYFHCTLECGFDKRVSIRADGSYFLTTQGDYRPFHLDHSLLLGAFYHIPISTKGDFYFGLQPGASIIQQNKYTYNDSTINNPKIKIAPIITGAVGVNYFFWKYMNMFFAVKYIHGNHVSQYGKAIPLDEIRISAGLGWQIHIGRNKNKKKV